MKNIPVYLLRTACAGAVLLLAACGAAPTRTAAPGAAQGQAQGQDDSVLQKLAVERWNLLIAHQAEKAYDFLSPGTKATEPREKYASEMNNRPVHWKSVDYVGHKCDDPDACTVELRAAYTVAMTARVGKDVSAVTILWERWIRVDGRWYYLQDRPSAPAQKAAAPAPTGH